MGWDRMVSTTRRILKRRSLGTLGLTWQGVSGSPALDSGLQDTTGPGQPRRSESRRTLHSHLFVTDMYVPFLACCIMVLHLHPLPATYTCFAVCVCTGC